jgi:hypothetical protein
MPSNPDANNPQAEALSAEEEQEIVEGRTDKAKAAKSALEKPKPPENKVVRLLEKNPLGLTLPEMAGGARQIKKIKLLRPMLAEAIRIGLVMPVSQRAGNTVYRLVKFLGPR